jgi:hypothetical protein
VFSNTFINNLLSLKTSFGERHSRVLFAFGTYRVPFSGYRLEGLNFSYHSLYSRHLAKCYDAVLAFCLDTKKRERAGLAHRQSGESMIVSKQNAN